MPHRTTRAVDKAEIKRRMSLADAALRAAGHQVTDLVLDELAEQVAAGTLTTEEVIARGLEHVDAR